MSTWADLYALADDHHGVVTAGLACQAGVSRNALYGRIRRERWTRLWRGAHLLPGSADTPSARAAAALLLLGERTAISHGTAAYLHGLLPTAPTTTTVTVPVDRAPTSRDRLAVTRSSTLLRRDVQTVDGIAVTSPAWTLADFAALVPETRLLDLVTDAEQRRLVTLDELDDVAARRGRAAGAGRFRRVVRTRREDRSDSRLEYDTRTACRQAGFAPSPAPFPVRCADGRLIHLDVAFPEIWFAIECDGFGFHADRRAFEIDRRRWREAIDVGWRITWVTRARLRDDLDGLIAEVAQAHRTADPARPPARPAA